MNTKFKLTLLAVVSAPFLFTLCTRDHHGKKNFEGIAYLDSKDLCNSASQNATFSLNMTGDLEGCLYTFVDEFTCTDGNYVEKGREYFVGTYKGKSGTFKTTYDFQAKFEGCNADGSYAGAEISGQCQHPLVDGSGTGVFQNVGGYFEMIDNVTHDPIDYSYKGYFKF